MEAPSQPIEDDLRRLSVALTTPYPGECLMCFVARQVEGLAATAPCAGHATGATCGSPGRLHLNGGWRRVAGSATARYSSTAGPCATICSCPTRIRQTRT